jgi:hypothetical protein
VLLLDLRVQVDRQPLVELEDQLHRLDLWRSQGQLGRFEFEPTGSRQSTPKPRGPEPESPRLLLMSQFPHSATCRAAGTIPRARARDPEQSMKAMSRMKSMSRAIVAFCWKCDTSGFDEAQLLPRRHKGTGVPAKSSLRAIPLGAIAVTASAGRERCLVVNQVISQIWHRQRPFATHPSAHVWGRDALLSLVRIAERLNDPHW